MDEDLLPNEKRYSIVHCDRWKSPSDPDVEVKMYETDDLQDVALPPDHVGISVLAYDADGTMIELTEREGDTEARERVLDAIDELQTDELDSTDSQ